MQKVLSLAIGIIILLSCKQSKTEVDTIIYNATIYIVDSAFSTTEAVAISEGKIVATGSNQEIKDVYSSSQTFNLNGAYLYPGFIDAHTHFYHYGMGLSQVNLVGTKSLEEVVERVKNFQELHQLDFIKGRGWDQNDWEIKEFPDKSQFDSLFPQTPVLLKRIDGHAALANQAALDYAGINNATTISGGVLQKKEGQLTGVLIDNAVDLIEPPEMKTKEKVEALLQAQQNLFDAGITTVVDAGLKRNEIELIDSLQQLGLLKMRVYAMVSDSKEDLDYYLKNGPVKTSNLNVSSFKYYMDGAMGSRGALLLEPYSDDPGNYGLLLSEVEHFEDAAERLSEAGWQMCVHAIGDSANRLVLDIYEGALKNKDQRWRIEHAQVIHPGDMDRFGKLGVIPSIQPTHATSDMYWIEERLGKQRLNRTYAYKSLLLSAKVIPLGTDFPVEDISPLKTFSSSFFRQDAEQFPKGGFLANEGLSRKETLKGMTLWPAYANFEEREKGSVEPGKWADFTVLDTDLMTADQKEILNAKVLATFVAGQKVNSN